MFCTLFCLTMVLSIFHYDLIRWKHFPCEGNPPVTGGFPSRRPVMWSFDVFFDLRLDKQLSKPSTHQWFEMPSCSLWHHCNILGLLHRNWGGCRIKVFYLPILFRVAGWGWFFFANLLQGCFSEATWRKLVYKTLWSMKADKDTTIKQNKTRPYVLHISLDITCNSPKLWAILQIKECIYSNYHKYFSEASLKIKINQMCCLKTKGCQRDFHVIMELLESVTLMTIFKSDICIQLLLKELIWYGTDDHIWVSYMNVITT